MKRSLTAVTDDTLQPYTTIGHSVAASMRDDEDAIVVRCPYCVSGDKFRPMAAVSHGAYVCKKCGHMTMPKRTDFKCHCPKSAEMRSHHVRLCN